MSRTRGAWPWWVGPLTVLSALLLSGVAASVVTGLVGQQFNASYAHWAGLLQDAVWLAVAVAIPWLCVKRPTSADYGLRRPTPKRAAITVLVAAVVFAAFSAIYAALAGVGEEPNQKIALTGFGESTVRNVAFVLLYGAVAPLAEEVLFRGVLFGALTAATSTPPQQRPPGRSPDGTGGQTQRLRRRAARGVPDDRRGVNRGDQGRAGNRSDPAARALRPARRDHSARRTASHGTRPRRDDRRAQRALVRRARLSDQVLVRY